MNDFSMDSKPDSNPSTSTTTPPGTLLEGVDALLDLIRNPRSRFDEDNWETVYSFVKEMDERGVLHTQRDRDIDDILDKCREIAYGRVSFDSQKQEQIDDLFDMMESYDNKYGSGRAS